MRRSRFPGALYVCCLLVVGGIAAGAGTVEAQVRDSVRHGPLLARGDVLVLGAAGLGSVALFGWDEAVTRQIRGWSLQREGSVRSVMDGAAIYGQPGTILIGAGLWVSGRLAHDGVRERIGFRAVEAIVASGAVTGVLKGVAGRARPSVSSDARDFGFGRGVGRDDAYQSFPSQHATSAWAFASAVDAEWHRLQPSRPRWVPGVLYAAATLVAASRVYAGRHWTSDVVLGSAIGFVSGRAVVRWHGDRP